jgi:hypothetical protein
MLTDDLKDDYTLWGRKDRSGAEVFLPLNQSYSDYKRRFAEAIDALEEYEERSGLVIVQDLLAAPFDVIKLRAEEADDFCGSVPLVGGVTLVQAAKDLFVAAGCAAEEKRPYFPSRKPKTATDLLDSARLGQTERGSFVITIYVPVPVPDPMSAVPEIFDPSVREAFARRATKTLLKAVNAAGEAADESQSGLGLTTPFGKAMNAGVSANLCEALADIHAGTNAPSVEVDVRWSYMVPPPIGMKPALITAGQVPCLVEAGRFYRARNMPRTTIITGKVTRLERDDQVPGRIAIKTILGERTRKVRVVLSREDYHNALDAHDKDMPVLVEGELTRDGTRFEISNPTGFRVLQQLSLEE